MGSGGKAGSASKTNVWYGTMAGVLGIGPAWSLEYIILNGVIYPFNLARVGAADYVDISFGDLGNARFYWGTETQTPDPTLNAFEDHPPYRGLVYIVFPDFCFGKNGETNPPNVEVTWRRLPQQSLISNAGGSASNDGAFTANPVAVAAELLTSWDWAGINAAKVNATTFQATADSLQAEQITVGSETRSFAAVAPLWTDQVDLKSALADLSSVSGSWLRMGTDGRIEAGRWKRIGSVGTVTQITVNDLVETPAVDVADSDTLPNSFQVEFTDTTKHHKLNSTTPHNGASFRTSGILRRQVAKRPMLNRMEQAQRHADDLMRDNAVPKITVSLSVRRQKAVNPDGSYIRPGDYFTFPVQVMPTDADDVRLFRCTRRSYDPTGPITLIGELETIGSLTAISAAPAVQDNPIVVPPVYYRRIISLHPDTVSDSQPIFLLAARPGDAVTGINLQFDTSAGGDFPTLAGQSSFALPTQLQVAAASGASTVRLKLLPISGGVNPQRDKALLTDWSGGLIEANDDQLVIIAIKKSGGAIVYQADGVTPWVEVMSVNGVASVVATDTYDVPVLRGRQGTTALNFNAGSFPDAWANYEFWIALRSTFTSIVHPNFEALILSQATCYFRYQPYGKLGFYDPALAYTEHMRRLTGSLSQDEFVNQTSATAQPTDTYIFPGTELAPIVAAENAYSVVLTSESHAVACDSAGTVNSGELGASGTAKTTVNVYRGDTLLTAVAGSPHYDQFSIGTLAVVSGTATKETVNTVRSDTLTADTGQITIPVNVGGAFVVNKVYALVKAKAGTNGTNGATGATGPTGPAGATGIPGLDGSTTFYGVDASPPTALRIGDLWFVTDKAFELRRATATGSGSWVATLYTGSAPFEIISGVTYIKKAAIREVDAGVLIAGTITAAISIGSLGSLSCGTGFSAFSVNTTQLTYGTLLMRQYPSINGTELKNASGTHFANVVAYNSGGDSAFVSCGNSTTGGAVTMNSLGQITANGAITFTNTLSLAGAATLGSTLAVTGQASAGNFLLNASGKIGFTNFSSYMQEHYGMEMVCQDGAHPVRIVGALLMGGVGYGSSFTSGNIYDSGGNQVLTSRQTGYSGSGTLSLVQITAILRGHGLSD